MTETERLRQIWRQLRGYGSRRGFEMDYRFLRSCAHYTGCEMTILGVWIFAAACWHSNKINAYGMFWSLLAAILVSVFIG